MEEKEKLTSLVDGFVNIVLFVFKLVSERVIEVVDYKDIHDSMELSDFKLIVNVL